VLLVVLQVAVDLLCNKSDLLCNKSTTIELTEFGLIATLWSCD